MPSDERAIHPLNTFVVRFWQEWGTDHTLWRGQVQHVQSGERAAFADEEGLLTFVRRWVRMGSESAAVEIGKKWLDRL